jgi:hypothetical protein
VAPEPHCGGIGALPVYSRNALECWCEETGHIMGNQLGELAGTFGVNLILAAVSELATYGGLSLALVTGGALFH